MQDPPNTPASNFSGQSASGDARQHNGNVYNNTWHTYTPTERASDERLQQDRKNTELIRAAAEGQHVRVQYLLDSGAYLDHRDKYDLTALHHAIWSGFEDVVSMLLHRGADVNATSLTGGSPLCIAVLKERHKVVDMLLEHRAAINLPGPNIGTPLHCAAVVGNVQLATELLKFGAAMDSMQPVDDQKLRWVLGAAPNDVPGAVGSIQGMFMHSFPSQTNPLFLAISLGHDGIVKMLLDKGSNVNLASGTPNNDNDRIVYPLGEAARRGNHAILQLLIAKGANLELGEKRPDYTLTALLCTLIGGIFGNQDCAHLLIRAGACVDVSDEQHVSAVHMASMCGRVKTLRMLCDRGAQTNLEDARGATPLACAVEKNWIRCTRVLLTHRADPNHHWGPHGNAIHWAIEFGRDVNMEILSCLLEASADMLAINASGHTPLIYAFILSRTACLEVLLSHAMRQRRETSQCDDHDKSFLQDDLNQLLLMAAARAGSLDLVSRLIQTGADVATQTWLGETALHQASEHGQLPVISRLLNAGVDVDTKDKLGKTALHVAAKFGHLEIVSRLIRAGAYLSARNCVGETALHIVAEAGHMDILVKLLDAGADPSVRDARSRRPEKYAKSAGHQEIYELLLDKLRERY